MHAYRKEQRMSNQMQIILCSYPLSSFPTFLQVKEKKIVKVPNFFQETGFPNTFRVTVIEKIYVKDFVAMFE